MVEMHEQCRLPLPSLPLFPLCPAALLQRFTDGTNSPSACCFHTGILFSGGCCWFC